MRNRALHDALRDFALEAAALLVGDLRSGAELAFDVVGERRGASVLYSYKPLAVEFIAARWGALRALPTCAPAARALGSGAEIYLRLHAGTGQTDALEALRAMLERLYHDTTGFAFPEQRFEAVYAEIERALYEDTLRTAVAAPLHGVALEGGRVDLGEGLFMVAGDQLDAPSPAVWQDPDGSPTGPNVLLVLRRDVGGDASLPLTEARGRFAALVRAMRLMEHCGATLGPVAWGRADEGPWQLISLGHVSPARGPAALVTASAEAELLELLERVERDALAGRMGWALERFEAGLERHTDAQAISDHLLALRALFDGGDEPGRGAMALRVAALCADEADRLTLRRTVEHAFALEQRLMSGFHAPADDDAHLRDLSAVTRELEECLRALLRDVLCGYLEPNLKGAADDILVSSGEPLEIHAADIRHEPTPSTPGQATHVELDTEEFEAIVSEPPAVRRAPSSQPALRARDGAAARTQVADAGVTESADWGPDEAGSAARLEPADWDDAADYSAPV